MVSLWDVRLSDDCGCEVAGRGEDQGSTHVAGCLSGKHFKRASVVAGQAELRLYAAGVLALEPLVNRCCGEELGSSPSGPLPHECNSASRHGHVELPTETNA